MVHRSCCVEISNNSGCYTLANPRVYTDSGHCEVPPPPMVGPCSNASMFFNKTTGAATGAVGVLTYDLFNGDLGDYSHVLAVMFSVPYDRNLYSNWFAVGVLDRGLACDHDLYDLMYNGGEDGFARAKGDGSAACYEGDYVVVSGSMSDAHEAVIRVDVNDTGMY